MFEMKKVGAFTRCLSDEKVCCGSTEMRIGQPQTFANLNDLSTFSHY